MLHETQLGGCSVQNILMAKKQCRLPSGETGFEFQNGEVCQTAFKVLCDRESWNFYFQKCLVGINLIKTYLSSSSVKWAARWWQDPHDHSSVGATPWALTWDSHSWCGDPPQTVLRRRGWRLDPKGWDLGGYRSFIKSKYRTPAKERPLRIRHSCQTLRKSILGVSTNAADEVLTLHSTGVKSTWSIIRNTEASLFLLHDRHHQSSVQCYLSFKFSDLNRTF